MEMVIVAGHKIKKFILTALILLSANLYVQAQSSGVPYTKDLLIFINAYFNHDMVSQSKSETLYSKAVSKIPDDFSEYQTETHLARCDFYRGMNILATYDLTDLEHALDDSKIEYEDPKDEAKRIKAEANVYFDKALAHADRAILLNPLSGSDAYTIYSQIICANVTTRSTGYVIGNGLKISQYAKKALKINPNDATASYSAYSQDVYAPGSLGNPVRGRKMMLSFLENENLVCQKFDTFNYTCAVAYTYYRQQNYEDALEWYQKCLKIYPNNVASNNMIKKCREKLETD